MNVPFFAPGYINTAANDAADLTYLGVAVAMVFIPGPDDALVGVLVGRVVTKMAGQGIKMIRQGTGWVYKKGLLTLEGKALRKAQEDARKALLDEIGTNGIAWKSKDYKGGKHIPKIKDWKKIVESTRNGPAKYHPNEDIELLERTVHKYGQQTTKPGKRYMVHEFERVIGASAGKPSRWVRVEETGSVGNLEIHGHPLTYEKYLDYIRPR